MTKEPLISIIIPCYNVEKYIKECLNSVISQTYENLEIIIVNDGSTDRTETEIKLFLDDKNKMGGGKIKYFYQENQGLSGARNTGLDNMNGEYVCFLDSDDFIHHNYVKVLYNTLIKYNADISICDFMKYSEENSQDFEWKKDDTVIINTQKESFKLINTNYKYVVVWNKLYKAEIFNNLRFVPQKIHEDEFIIHYIMGKINKIAFINNVLLAYRQNPNSIMGSAYTDKKLMNAIEAFEDRELFYKKNNLPYIENVSSVKWYIIFNKGLLKYNFALAKDYILKNPIEYWRKLKLERTKKIKIYFNLVFSKIKELF